MTETEIEILEGEGPAPTPVYQHIAVRNPLGLKVLEGLRDEDKALGNIRQADKADKHPLVNLLDSRAILSNAF